MLGFVRALDVWLSIVIMGGAPMFLGLSPSATSQQDGVLSLGGFLGQLIESQASSTGGGDSSSGGSGESQSADVHFWDDDQSLVIEDVTDKDHGFSGVGGLGQFHKSRDGDWISSHVSLVKSLVDNCIEFGISSSGQETVKFDQQTVVQIVSLCLSEMSSLYSALFVKIDTLYSLEKETIPF